MAYTDPFAQQVQQLYAKYGRTASDQEIDAHRGNPGGLGAIDQLLQNDQQQSTQGAQPGSGSDPNVNTPNTFDPGSSAPTGSFPGWQWDANQARYVQSPADNSNSPMVNAGGGIGGTPSTSPDYGFTNNATSASSQMGGPGMLDPWLQPFTPRPSTGSLTAPPTLTSAPTLSGPSSPFSNPAFTAPGGGSFSYGDYQAPDKFSYGDYQAPDKYSNAAFTAPDKFVAPDDVTMQNDPGWKFRQKTGQQEFLNSAAAKGLGRSGGTMKDFINYNQEAASQEYGNVYNRALGEWNTDYGAKLGTYQTNTANAANVYNTNANQGLTAYQTNRANAADIYNTNANMGLTAYNTNRGNAFQNYQTNFGNALQGWQANTANNTNVYNTNWGAQKDVYNAAMQGWQGTNALNTDIWKTQNANTMANNQVNWNQDWQQYLQQYDAFKRNQEWPYQVLNQQSQPVG